MIAFNGIPFANVTKPLQNPAPKDVWKGELDCFAYGDACPQNESTGLGKILRVDVPKGADTGVSSDDCLNLNVLTPTLSTSSLLPVMVWIHGGSNVMGSNKGDFCGWSNTATGVLVRRGVVCVSLNYRVGAHGFLHLPEHGITNLALRDIICGLQWVQSEVSAFGGDPNRVTVRVQGLVMNCWEIGKTSGPRTASPLSSVPKIGGPVALSAKRL
jgi:para-nitrobenzyl esterase